VGEGVGAGGSTEDTGNLVVSCEPGHSLLTKDAWFHRRFRSQHGSKTTPPFTLQPAVQEENPLFPFFSIKNSLPTMPNFHLALIRANNEAEEADNGERR
jgi:hypothetical protein